MPLQEWIAFTVLRALPLGVASVLLALVSVALYRLCLHPLAGVPGPRLAAVSNIWHALNARDGRMLHLGKTLHKKYGSVVRVGPNEVWFDSMDAFRAIYRAGSGYVKSDFYLATLLQPAVIDSRLNLHFADTLDLLSERDIARYRLQRRLIGPLYQTSSVKKYESPVDDVLERVVAQIHALDGAEVDLKEWMHIIAVECLGAIVLTWSPGYLRDKTDWGSSAHGYMSWRRKSVLGLFPEIVKAELLSRGIGRMFSRVWGLTYRAEKGLKPFFTGVYRVSSRRINQELSTEPARQKPSKKPKQAPPHREDLLVELIKLHKEKPEFTETYLRRMATTNFGAGHETLCSALTSIMSMVGSHAQVQERVADEVRQTDKPLSLDDASQLQYMRATIKEAQRLYPVIGMSLSRTVPEGGLQAHGHFFPSGTTVGCNPVALHRNVDIFGPDANSFRPERWLDSMDVKGMERYNLIWGGGNRTCPGRHLAYLVLFKVVPALVREFDIEVSIPPEEDIRFYFMAMLTGVKARFHAREGTIYPM